jgi:hypothetical protein
MSTSEVVYLLIFLSLKPQHGYHANNLGILFIHDIHVVMQTLVQFHEIGKLLSFTIQAQV